MEVLLGMYRPRRGLPSGFRRVGTLVLGITRRRRVQISLRRGGLTDVSYVWVNPYIWMTIVSSYLAVQV
jgi:predicted small integral membrane protein